MHNLSSRRLRRFSARSVFATLSFGFAVTIGLHSAHAAELDPAQIMSTKGCAACHIIPGVVGAKGKMGPSLKGIGKRKRTTVSRDTRYSEFPQWVNRQGSGKVPPI